MTTESGNPRPGELTRLYIARAVSALEVALYDLEDKLLEAHLEDALRAARNAKARAEMLR